MASTKKKPNRANKRAMDKMKQNGVHGKQPAGEFKRLKDETVEAWETRFVKVLSDDKLVKMLFQVTMHVKSVKQQLEVLHREFKARDLKPEDYNEADLSAAPNEH